MDKITTAPAGNLREKTRRRPITTPLQASRAEAYPLAQTTPPSIKN
jgi:hypothetical protein